MNIVSLFFYISLAILVLRFSPIDIFDRMFGLIGVIAGVYVTISSLHMLVKNTKEVKLRINWLSLYLINKIVLKDSTPRNDIVKFLLVSLLIAFSIDIIMVKISDKPVEDFVNYVPGIEPMKELVNFSQIASQVQQIFNPSPKVDNSPTYPGVPLSSNKTDGKATAGKIRPFVDAAIGGFTIFFLRQFIYKNRYIERTPVPKNPGSRILILFIIVSMIIFALGFGTDISSGFASMKKAESIMKMNGVIGGPFDFPFFIQTLSGNANLGTSYGMANAIIFLVRFTNPFVYLVIISIWTFDWYLFSNVWAHYNDVP